MAADDEDLERVARRYWVDRVTMDVVAREEGVSRSTVSRMLDAARARGIVQVSVGTVHGRASALAAALRDRFGVDAVVEPVPEGASDLARLEGVAARTGALLDGLMGSGMVLGVAWGTTTSAVGRQLGARSTVDAHVVQLNGAANTRSSGLGYAGEVIDRFGAAWGAEVHQFPVPAFFDAAATRRAMWRERSVRGVLALQQRCDIALFGVGTVAAGVPSRVYTAGYLTDADRLSLAEERVVGDVCTVFLRADGSWQGVPLNARSSGPPPPALRRIPRRVCAVAGTGKVPALAAALAAGLVTDLVVDGGTARALLAHR
ncbi:sugar-binding transcriptional regulator [uncultured Pseudokineococcus sp.]|uniref:sugar-binding transcriptional regulator n=1 Tax=uncultured Pseudokineococcus sp. TaxID=1642928 RepID=UPI00262EB8AF|nr:sugar-binding domain-containing protein [uncultured Pseudokineococcus sp.]